MKTSTYRLNKILALFESIELADTYNDRDTVEFPLDFLAPEMKREDKTIFLNHDKEIVVLENAQMFLEVPFFYVDHPTELAAKAKEMLLMLSKEELLYKIAAKDSLVLPFRRFEGPECQEVYKVGLAIL